MQIVDHPRAIARLVVRRTGVNVLHSVTYGVVEQHGDLARRGGHRLGLADASREPPVERAQRGVGPSNSYTAARRRSAAARLPQRRVLDDSTFPPEILLLGAKPSQEVKCFALAQAERSSPHSAIGMPGRWSPSVDRWPMTGI